MWQIVLDKDGNKILAEQDNTKYYLCKRFFAHEKYKAFSKLPFDEIISVDSMLFPITDRIILNSESAATSELAKGNQILRVRCIGDTTKSFVEELEGYTFCGYDLADEYEISALTNCGGFDETFTYKNLNEFGLIPGFLEAIRIQTDLAQNNPDEGHADCLLFAIWRRI